MTRIYCGRLRSPMASSAAQNVLSVASSHASGPFAPTSLPSGFSLGLVTNGVMQ